MNILFVLLDTHIAGGQRMAITLAEYIKSKGYKVSVCVLSQKGETEYDKELDEKRIETYYMEVNRKNRVLNKIDQYRHLDRIVRKINPDIIHCHLEYFVTGLYALVKNKSIIITIHSQPYRIASMRLRVIYSLLKKKEGLIPVALTESEAVEFSEQFNYQRNKIYVIPNPINLKDIIIKTNYHNVETIKYVFASRFHPVKNHRMLLEAFEMLIRENPNVKLILIGDGEELESIKNMAKELGISSNVEFTGVLMDIPKRLYLYDVAVVSSKSESFSIFLVEAMAAGLPTVVTGVGGMKDVALGNSIIVQNDDKFGFAKAMKMLAEDEKLRKEMGERARVSSTNYDVEIVCKEYLEVYKRAIFTR